MQQSITQAQLRWFIFSRIELPSEIPAYGSYQFIDFFESSGSYKVEFISKNSYT